MDTEQLPSKKVLILGLVLAAVVIVVLQTTGGGVDTNVKVVTEDGEVDSDGDGLADWEEELWLTDPLVADTDGDGTSDGDEVAQNRHPRVAGDDAITEDHKDLIYLSTQQPISGKTIVDETVIPRTVLTGGKRVAGLSSDDAEVNELFDPLLREASKTLSFYTRRDISIDASLSSEAYFTSLIEIAIEGAREEQSFERPTTLLARMYAGEVGAETRLEELIALYEEMRDAYLALPAHPSFAEEHLEIVNAYATIVYGLEEAQKAVTDPSSGLVGLEQFERGNDRLESVFFDIGSRLSTEL